MKHWLSCCNSLCLFRFEFSVSLVELHRRSLDVAVKNGGGLLSKHKGLLGKVQSVPFPLASQRSDLYLFR